MRNWSSIGLFAVLVFLLLYQLGSFNVTIMEARNFVTAREMLNEGNILIPTLNGDYRLEKPPLPTWLTAMSARMTGTESLFWLRFPAALMGVLALLFMVLINKKLLPESPDQSLPAIVLFSSFYFFLMSRSGMWDIYAQSFALGSVYFYLRIFKSNCASVVDATALAFMLAASFMSKGPVALYGLFLPFIIAYHFVYRRDIRFDRKQLLTIFSAVILAIGIASIWPLYIYYSEAGRAAADIVTRETGNWSSYNVRPFYYYWSFPTQSGIWTIFGFVALVTFGFGYRRLKTFRELRFFFLWTVLVVLLLSIIPEKKSRYLLPVLFPLAFFLAEFTRVKISGGIRMVLYGSLYVTAGLLTIGGLVLLFINLPDTSQWALRYPGSIAILFLGLFAIYKINTNGLRQGVAVISAAFGVAILAFIVDISHMLDAPNPVRSFDEITSNPVTSNLPLYSIGEIRPELIWHLGKKAPELKNCTLPESEGPVGIFSYYERDTICPNLWKDWQIKDVQIYDQNPKTSLKEPNEALIRYFWIIERKNQ